MHTSFINDLIPFILSLTCFEQLRVCHQEDYTSSFTCILACNYIYEACPESNQPFWISRKPFVWRWFNLAASQRGSYCVSVNSHSSVGLVSRQWDTVDWVCVLCDRRIHNARASISASSPQCTCPFYSSYAGVFGKTSHHPGLSAPPTDKIWLPATSGFSQS